MKNKNAVKINDKLGFNLFNELTIDRLEVNKFTKKQIAHLCIDDLIDSSNRATDRLRRYVYEIAKEEGII